MAAPFKWYGNGLLKVVTGQIDLDTDTFKLMLTTSAYTPNQDTHDFRDDVTNEVAASGSYAAGGITLTGIGVTYDAATNEVRIVWSDPATITGFTGSVRTMVIYKSRGGAASADELLGYASESADITATAGPLAIDLPTPAVLKITAA